MKKFAIIAIFCLIAVFVCLAAGCTPAKLDKVVGTYVLTEKSTKDVDKPDSYADLIEKNHIKEYLVITGEGKGYRVYKDDYTSLTCNEIKITNYTFSSNDKNKLMSFTAGINVNNRSETISLYVDAKSNKEIELVYKHDGISSSISALRYSTTTVYKKISSKTDLSTVNNELGATLTATPYELTHLHGLCQEIVDYSYLADKYYPYIYRYFDIDVINKTATVYYAEKSAAPVQKTETVAVDYEIAENGEVGNYGHITVGEVTFTFIDDLYNTQLKTETQSGEMPMTSHLTPPQHPEDLSEWLTNEIEYYLSTLPQE